MMLTEKLPKNVADYLLKAKAVFKRDDTEKYHNPLRT
jgi:hypothetical protein